MIDYTPAFNCLCYSVRLSVILKSLGFTIVSETFIKKVWLQLRPSYNSNCQIQSPVWPEKKTLWGWFFLDRVAWFAAWWSLYHRNQPHVRETLAYGIWNPGLWNPHYSSRNPEFPTNDWNLESKLHPQRLESGSWNPESVTWNPRSKTVLDSLTR